MDRIKVAEVDLRAVSSPTAIRAPLHVNVNVNVTFVQRQPS